MDTAGFVALIAARNRSGLVFGGGAGGLPPAWRPCRPAISLPMTFPHELARAMLANRFIAPLPFVAIPT
jgi:23S rRNA pseudoU1915 N3-methylase RlmH